MSSGYRSHRVVRIFEVDSIYSCFARAAELFDLLLLELVYRAFGVVTQVFTLQFCYTKLVPRYFYMLSLGKHSSCSCCIASTASRRHSWSDGSVGPLCRSFTEFSGARLQEIKNHNKQHSEPLVEIVPYTKASRL
jgi:hypothetical protein